MKNLVMIAFLGLLLISSCKCNDKGSDADTATTDTLDNTSPDSQPADATATDGSTDRVTLSDDEFRRLFDIQHYTDAEVREFRRMHDEMDWGGVPGYYPEGSTRPLTENDTKFLTVWGHKVMLNEIYARHGMAFDDPDLEEFFNNKEWYRARKNNVQASLTQQEKDNIEFLKSHDPASL